MNIGVRDTLHITFGDSKTRQIVIVSEIMGTEVIAMSVNLDGRKYPVSIKKMSPTDKNAPENSGRQVSSH